MTFVTAQPEVLTAAAGQLQEIGVVPAAADEVSALTATQFSAYATSYQTVSAQASKIDEMFVRMLGTSADSYAATEAANAIAAS